MHMKNNGSKDVLGIDIGGVIIQPMDHDKDTSFLGENYLKTPAIEGAFAAIHDLGAGRFGADIHLVSKCGPRVERKSREWLDARGFFATTGVPSDNLHFCRERHEKAPICEKLGITHFVDDRLEVLSHMATVANLFLFRPRENEVRRFAQHLDRVRRVESWEALKSGLLAPSVAAA